jgi:hypothetical protein
MGWVQRQRLLQGGVGLFILAQAKLSQTDKVMRVGLTHMLARPFAELGEVVRAVTFRKLRFAGPDQALNDGFGFARATELLQGPRAKNIGFVTDHSISNLRNNTSSAGRSNV